MLIEVFVPVADPEWHTGMQEIPPRLNTDDPPNRWPSVTRAARRLGWRTEVQATAFSAPRLLIARTVIFRADVDRHCAPMPWEAYLHAHFGVEGTLATDGDWWIDTITGKVPLDAACAGWRNLGEPVHAADVIDEAFEAAEAKRSKFAGLTGA